MNLTWKSEAKKSDTRKCGENSFERKKRSDVENKALPQTREGTDFVAIDALAPMRLARQNTVEQLVHEKEKQCRSVQRSESNVVPSVTIRESIDKKRHQSADNMLDSVKHKVDTNITVKERLKKLQELSSNDSLNARKASISKLEEAVACIQTGERFSVQKIVKQYQTQSPGPALSQISISSISRQGSEYSLVEDFNDESSEDKADESDNTMGCEVKKKKDNKIHMVAKEIMTSERVYVNVLKLVAEKFPEFLEKKKKQIKKEVIPAQKLSDILSNIQQILELNSGLLKDFEERINNWESNKKIADVLVKKGPFLQLYSQYLNNFDKASRTFEDCRKTYPHFDKAVREFESDEACANLRLNMHMLKPVQRLPQYQLLLRDYLKQQDETSVDFESTKVALAVVTNAAEKSNSAMKEGEDFQKMLRIQMRLGDYSLIQPGRMVIKEGMLLKISRGDEIERYFILLNDLLLYCHYQVKKYFTIFYLL